MTSRLDLLALGNAIVDVIAHTDDDFLAARNLHKGSMNSHRRGERARTLRGDGTGDDHFRRFGLRIRSRGAASLGLKTGFIGKVRDDGGG